MNFGCFTEHCLPCFQIQRRAMSSGYLWLKHNPQWQCHYHILPSGWSILLCHCHKGLKRYFRMCSLLYFPFLAHFSDFWHCIHEAELKEELMSLPSNFLSPRSHINLGCLPLKAWKEGDAQSVRSLFLLFMQEWTNEAV